jgi:excisionase family DNA binding protein
MNRPDRPHVPDLVNSVGAAEIGVTRPRITQLVQAGELPCFRIGQRSVLFARADVEAYARQRAAKAVAT